jgi:hypothetical protein
MSNWRFDENDPGEVTFNKEVEEFGAAVRPAVERALIQILEDPLANQFLELFEGDLYYVSVVQPSLQGDEVIPALLIIYSAKKSEWLVRKVAIHPAREFAPKRDELDEKELQAALRRAIRIARRRARERRNH